MWHFSNMKIGTRISLTVFIVLFLLVGIISVFSIGEFSQMNHEQASEQAIKGVNGLKQMINDSKANAIQTAMLLGLNPSIASGIKSQTRSQLDLATKAVMGQAGIDFITILDAQGKVIYRAHEPEKYGDSQSDQLNVQAAMEGKTLGTVETSSVIKLSVRAGAPVYDENNSLVGIIVTGTRLDNSEMLDDLKTVFKTEMTVFLGDERIATTIIQDGKRAVGTKLDPKIAEVILKQKQAYSGQANILGSTYITHYEPLLAEDGEVMGVLFAGQPVDVFNAVVNRLILLISLISLVVLAGCGFVLYLIINRSVTRPLNEITLAADQLAQGNVDLAIKASGSDNSKNEIARLSRSFRRMTENIRNNAGHADKLAKGELDLDIQVQSDKDILSISLNRVKTTLSSLIEETGQLTQAAVQGKLSVRGKADQYSGGYRQVIEGFNQTLDAIIMPIKEASDILAEMEAGNLNRRMQGQYQGDHARIKQAMNSTMDALNRYINEISQVLTEMANSNFVVGIQGEYHGDFAPIKQALNLIIDSFNTVLADMIASAEQVEAGSQQVSDGSQGLSRGATEQAGAIEQLMAAISEIAQQTRTNAQNAGQANELAVVAQENATRGDRQMAALQQAMVEINASSASIANIIKVIDEIAFQTNILALNAAVEAARAGQYGRGFAVVAEEVRNLAAKSATAAKETSDLIETSIKKTTAGTSIANQTAEAFKLIVENVAKTAELVEMITASSGEQATGIAQINEGVNQVSAVVQANSATAEQSAATSEELSGQAVMLKQMISQFKLKIQLSHPT